jgi:Rha family phage regulatory protein|nr:MAG TPA: regulatory protein [Herelleviridae sp.]DAI90461.1 MAG TPA: regulatory protein [Caudoviricetes sp.]DAJ33190.1 MAG TPA: regulatory protein [Herelleviridae sp.]DAW04987.1 MAG TPA: regulatory protein [Caudoviricetes sp.]DAW38231.1 MAG TPA: regulatory protein [Caudoviricetes sp.]
MLVEIVGKRYEEKLITTSLKVAEVFEKEHKNVLQSIENLVADNSAAKFFRLTTYKNRGKEYPMYEMDRDGFSLLVMGFTGEKALQWKIKYIEAFNKMESELKRLYTERQQWQIERDKGVVIRHILTDTIKMKITESPNKRFAYPNYTNLIYRNLFGKTAKELESDYGVKAKENLRDFFTGDDLAKVQSMEMLVSSLINCGWGYQQIKEFVQREATKMIA